MQKKEFESLIGRELKSSENYQDIENIYMASDLDKVEFARLWMNDPHALLKEIAAKSSLMEAKLYEKNRQDREEGYQLAKIAHEFSSTSARELAIQKLGFREYISFTFKKGYHLWKVDQEYILQNL